MYNLLLLSPSQNSNSSLHILVKTIITKRHKITRVVEDMKELEPLYVAGENVK